MASQKFLDQGQYSKQSIRRYEKIFGTDFIAGGGKATSTEYAEQMALRPGERVLEVGCGIGGMAFMLSQQYGAIVYSIDLSSNAIGMAKERLQAMPQEIRERVEFEELNVFDLRKPTKPYDVFHSKDTLLHISDKVSVFKHIKSMMAPGGRIHIADYCRGEGPPSEEFREYVARRGYDLRTVAEYGAVLEEVGFKDVRAIDMTKRFEEALHSELNRLLAMKQEFIEEFSQEEFDSTVSSWKNKLRWVSQGHHKYGVLMATV